MSSLTEAISKPIHLSYIKDCLRDVRLGALANAGVSYLIHEYNVWKNNSNGVIKPTTLYMELTTKCPRECKDCYISVEDRLDPEIISIENVDKIMQNCETQGIRVYTLLGGEPMMKETLPIIKYLLHKHPLKTFVACTNGDYIANQKDKLDDILLKNNFIAALSVDGFQETNDELRGRNSFKNVMESASYLKSIRSFYGSIITLRQENYMEATSIAFRDLLVSKGFKFLSFAFPSRLTQETIDEAIHNIESWKDEHIMVYTGLFGHLGNHDNHTMAKVVSMDKRGRILKKRRERIEIGDTDTSLDAVSNNPIWRERYEHQM